MKLSEWIKCNLEIEPGMDITIVEEDDTYSMERESIGTTFDEAYDVRGFLYGTVILRRIPGTVKPIKWEKESEEDNGQPVCEQLKMECVYPQGMDEILTEFGIKVTHSESGGRTSSGVIGCRKEIQQIYEKLGDEKFYELIFVDTHAWPNGGYKRWNKFILRDLAAFIDVYYDTENYDRQILICHISKQVRKDIPITPDDFLEMIEIYDNPGSATERLYSNGFQKKNKLTKIRGNIL